MGAIKIGKKTINRSACTFSISGGTSFSSATSVNRTSSEKLIHRAKVIYISNTNQSGTNTVDGITVIVGDIVLCTGQTDAKQNGLYIVRPSAWDRADDTLLAGHLVRILEGTTYANSIWGNSNTTDPIVGTSTITYTRKDTVTGVLLAANNLSDISNATTARTNLGLGSMAIQNNTSVSIAGGNISGLNQLSVTGANSNISIGATLSASITSKSSGTITLQNSGGAGANFRLLQGAVDGVFPLSSGAGMSFQMTNTSNASPFLYLIRNRLAGNSTNAVSAETQTNSTLHTDDRISFSKRITPNSGVSVANYFQTGVSDTSSSAPSSFEDVFVTEGGISVRSTRFAARMMQICRSTLGAVRLFVSNTINTTYDLIFPDTAPTANTVLLYGADGVATWQRILIPQILNANTTAVSNSHYIVHATGTGQVSITLPTAANSKIGDTIKVTRAVPSEKDWRISQQDNQQMLWNIAYSTIGTTGWAESAAVDSSVTLLCITNDGTNTRWQVVQQEGLLYLY